MSYQAYLTPALATTGVLTGIYCAYYCYKEVQKNKLPEKWREVGTLGEIISYPIKSCGGIWLPTAECSIFGPKKGWLRDRILMVIDDKNNFMTARVKPELLLVKPSMKSSILKLEHRDQEAISVDLAEVIATETPFNATVWGVTVPVYDCGLEASEWFTRLFGESDKKYRLAYYASHHTRNLRQHMRNEYFKFAKKDTGALPDEVAFNMINEASVEDLNSRLKDCTVTYRNFRPNFVLRGAKPYEEDNWKFVKIGENVFEILKPCLRCVLTTIDPETGVRSKSAQPLEMLKSYRKLEDPEALKAAGNSPRMGLQMTLRSKPGGMVSLNDTVYVA